MMKLKYNKNLNFQRIAIDSIIDVFKSQKYIEESFEEYDFVSNKLYLDKNQILSNVNHIQERNNIEKTKILNGMNFTVEMETGTGKTYVYLRTILELNQEYAFKKFIIVVPSIAIREGVLKTIKDTKKHFDEIYGGISLNSFEYKGDISKIREFTRANDIQVMIITLASFNKTMNVLYKSHESIEDYKPIDLIAKTNPILILDEPQNMESQNSKKAIDEMNPLCTLRYSATHREYYNLLYRLTPSMASKLKLVKKIFVKSIFEDDNFNYAYIRCNEIISKNNNFKVKLTVDKKTQNNIIKRRIITVNDKNGKDLFEKTNNSKYAGYRVSEINIAKNFISFENGIKIHLHDEIGTNKEDIMRVQIEETIKQHFDNYDILKPHNIKPLSLFFLEKVDDYNNDDAFIKNYFDEVFNKLKIKHPYFKKLNAKNVRSGYFSIMKIKKNIEKDYDAFELIMKNKERLMSFEEPVQFIFSHSALREGWDNPNIFNICSLHPNRYDEITKRQEIGRGLRLSVDQNGDRYHGEENNLTIIANERYQEFAKALQDEYEVEYGAGSAPDIIDVSKLKKLRVNKKILSDPKFKEFWNKISRKTKYEISIDSPRLVSKCIDAIQMMNPIEPVFIMIESAIIKIDDSHSITPNLQSRKSVRPSKFSISGNLVKEIANNTHLTYGTVLQILLKINNFKQFFNNPQAFIELVSNIINTEKLDFLVRGIKYQKINDWYEMALFTDRQTSETVIDLKDSQHKSTYDKIIYQQGIEKKFVDDACNTDMVEFFVKLPPWFTINTPMGQYNPDWGVRMINHGDKDKKYKLYFVAETKSTLNLNELRPNEARNIRYGRKHFEAIGVEYEHIITLNDLTNSAKN